MDFEDYINEIKETLKKSLLDIKIEIEKPKKYNLLPILKETKIVFRISKGSEFSILVGFRHTYFNEGTDRESRLKELVKRWRIISRGRKKYIIVNGERIADEPFPNFKTT
ncbi:MAG: hypothetical protein V3U02_05055 [Calditrichia bacterium]